MLVIVPLGVIFLNAEARSATYKLPSPSKRIPAGNNNPLEPSTKVVTL